MTTTTTAPFEAVYVGQMCLGSQFLSIQQTADDCLRSLRGNLACSAEFFQHATGFGGFCGCVQAGMDCTLAVNRAPMVNMWIYRAHTTTTSTATMTTATPTQTTTTTTATDTSTSSTISTTGTHTSTRTATLPTRPVLVSPVASSVEAVASQLASVLALSSEATIVVRSADRVAQAVKVTSGGVYGSQGEVTVSAPLLGAAATLPQSVVAMLGSDSIAVFQVLNDTARDTMQRSTGTQTTAMLGLSIFLGNGQQFGSQDPPARQMFQDPVLLTMPVAAADGLRCMFWDDAARAWSPEGVATQAGDQGALVCATHHLSLFGATVEPPPGASGCVLDKALANVGAVGQNGWWFRPAALFFFLFMLAHFMMVTIATFQDLCRWLLGGRVGFLLAPQDGIHGPPYCALLCFKVSPSAALMRALRHRWTTGDWEPLQVLMAVRAARLFGAAAIGVDPVELEVIRWAAERHLQHSRVTMHISPPNGPEVRGFGDMEAPNSRSFGHSSQEGGQQGGARLAQEGLVEVYLRLEASMNERIEQLFSPETPSRMRFAIFLAAVQPWAAVSRRGCCVPTVVFTGLALARDLGAAALLAILSALLFPGSWGCGMALSGQRSGIYVAFGLGAAALAALPERALAALALGSRIVTQSSFQPWGRLERCWACLLTAATPAYAGGCAFLVVTFLASAIEEGASAWLLGAAVAALVSQIVNPLLLAIFHTATSGAVARRPKVAMAALSAIGALEAQKAQGISERSSGQDGMSQYRSYPDGPAKAGPCETFDSISESAVSVRSFQRALPRGSPRSSPRSSQRSSPKMSRQGSSNSSARGGSTPVSPPMSRGQTRDRGWPPGAPLARAPTASSSQPVTPPLQDEDFVPVPVREVPRLPLGQSQSRMGSSTSNKLGRAPW